jgi:hypothetical protein
MAQVFLQFKISGKSNASIMEERAAMPGECLCAGIHWAAREMRKDQMAICDGAR